MTKVRRFGRFWYDFLVGDKLELFVGPIAALVITAVALKLGLHDSIAGLLLFALIVAVAAVSLLRSMRVRTGDR